MAAHLRLRSRFRTEVMPSKGWASIPQVAAATGVHHTTLYRLEGGEPNVSGDTIAALLEATGEPFAGLFIITHDD